jgi:hypothetical protein
MVLAIVGKELRELRLFAALALLAFGVYVSNLTGHWSVFLSEVLGWLPALGAGPDVRFVRGEFSLPHGLIGFALALALGFRQSVGELFQGTFPFLLHRPLSRRAIILTKLLAGAGLLMACTLLPILIYAAWAATPGTHPGPFEWSMTARTFQLWLTMPLIYLGAFASGFHQAHWAARPLPLVAVVAPAAVLQAPFVPRWIAVPALLLMAAVMISNILLEAETRDF